MNMTIFIVPLFFPALEPTELPVFQQPLSNVMARVGQKIKLECVVTGIPEPQIYWTHNGKPYSARGPESKVSKLFYLF